MSTGLIENSLDIAGQQLLKGGGPTVQAHGPTAAKLPRGKCEKSTAASSMPLFPSEIL